MENNRCWNGVSTALLILAMVFVVASAHAELGVNMIPNPSFEEANGDLPDGWTVARVAQEDPAAIEYLDASEPGANGALGPSTGDHFLRFVNAPESAVYSTIIEQDTWIPVQTDIPYRFRMQYRFEDVLPEALGNSKLELRIVFGYDANPGGPPNPQAFSYGEVTYEAIQSHCCGAPPVETTYWRLVQTDLIFDGAPVLAGGAVRDIAFVRLRLEPHIDFKGTVSVDDLSMVELANAEFSGPASSRAYDFVSRVCAANSANRYQACVFDDDCPGLDANNDSIPDNEASCVENLPTAGFLAVPFNRRFAGEGENEYGFDFDEGSSPPVGYDRNTYPTAFASNHVNRNAIFKTALPDGEYRVSLFMGGYWRNDPGLEVHMVDFNGVAVIDESGDWADNYALKDHWYFKNVEATLVTDQDVASTGRAYALYEDAILPRYRRHDETVVVTGGEGLEINNRNGTMAGVVITPTNDQAAHESAIEAFETGLADEFVSHFATYVPPSEFGLPVVQGDFEFSEGEVLPEYTIFHRHWMNFVEFTSRPEQGEPELTELIVAATPGEFEPVTFSVWPQQQLENATIVVSDLLADGGTASIPSQAVRVWYLQQKPWRDKTEFSFVGTYLPDWGSRTLYTDVTQRAWLNVHVPEGATPGLYRGQVTFAADGVPPTVLDLTLEVRAFSLERPPRVHVQRGGGSRLILSFPSEGFDDSEGVTPQIHNREYYRKAAYQDLYDHGFQPEINPWFSASVSGGVWWDENGDFIWSHGDISGSADDQLARFDHSPFGAGDVAWIDGSTGRVIDAFISGGGGEWDPTDVARWLSDIESKLYGERGITTIYLHATSEESHYSGSAWTNYLDFVRDYRDVGYQGSAPWPHVYSAHTSNTSDGQVEAIAHADFPLLGMFHGVGSPIPSEQIAAAKAAGKPFGLYGMRGRFGPGFYLWKSGASLSFHEFYAPYSGTLNDDWEEHYNVKPQENPGQSIATYSQSGRMVGTWYSEELREGVDDDAYLFTLDTWIDQANCESSSVPVCIQALIARQTVFDSIDLDVYASEEDFEELGISGRLSRIGLELYRPMQPEEFDVFRAQVAQAIEGLSTTDSDQDGLLDIEDNCWEASNAGQANGDGDALGDVCDDSDGDGLMDAVETQTGVYVSPSDTGTDPNQADTDGDLVPDGVEVAAGLDPNVANETTVPILSPVGLGALILLLAGFGAGVRYRKGSRSR
jgi:hypothetical protein